MILLFALVSLGQSSSFSQPFRINPTQVDVILSPGFNHLPMTVNVLSNSPTFDLNAIEVSSDAGWVQPSVDKASGKIVLTFATSNLINLSHTATLTARQGTNNSIFFVNGTLIPLQVIKLVDDPVRSRVYGIHLNGLEKGNVLVIDPLSGNSIGSITVGRKPTDLAVSRDGRELFVLNTVDKTISVLDLQTLRTTETIQIPYDNWGPSDTTGDIEVGPGSILYYSDGSWAPQLRVYDRTTAQVVQTVTAGEHGFGDFALTSDFRTLIGWAQYGWHAGWGGSYAVRYNVDASGQLTFAEQTDGNYPTSMGRDPLDTPVLVSADNTKVFIKQFGFNSGSLKPTLHAFPSPVYSISPGAEVVATAAGIYESSSGNKVYDMPVNAPVQVITSDYARLVYFDPQARAIRTINLFTTVGSEILKRQLAPANGSIVLSPDRLSWQPLAGVDSYHLYLGVSSNLVSSATTNSPFFLGTVSAAEIFLTSPLAPGTAYFWRIDAITQNEVIKGDINWFTVSAMSSSTSEINVTTIQGHRNFHTSVQLDSEPAGYSWSASADVPWISFINPAGVTPATLSVTLDASQLPIGLNTGNIMLSNGTNVVFTLPVKLRVEALNLTLLESDPQSELVYGINEDVNNPAARAYLLEINTRTEGIERLIPVGNSVTDIAVHNGDGRIYVPNWMGGSLLAVNKTNFVVERTYAFRPFAGTGYGEGDVFKVAAGAPGRLVVEEQDQWIDITIFDTINGTNIARAFEREGGGAFGGNGRYYYHGDNNSSGAEIHQYDVIGDAFNKLAHIRVASAGYYGSRVVVVSDDGQRVFWNGSVFNADLVEEWTIGEIIYSTTPDGRYAFAHDKIYDIARRQVAMGMPAPTAVSAFNSTTRKLVVPVGGSIRFFVLPETPVLPKPALSVASKTENSVSLHWTDNSLETGFTLQKRLAGDSLWNNAATLAQNVTATTLNELTRETTYEFRIKAEASGLSSDWSDILSVTTPGSPPNTPTLNVLSVSTTSVILEWPNAAAVIYTLERRETGSAAWIPVIGPSGTISSYTDFTVVAGNTYEYRLLGTNSWGAAYSGERPVTVPLPSPPAAPAGLDAQVASASSIQITWNAVPDATGYILERRTDSPSSWIQIKSLPADTLSFLDTNVLTGTEYWYRAAATNSIGRSAYSQVDNVILTLVQFACIVSDDFDPGLDPAVWAEISGGWVIDGGPGFTSGKALWFGTNTTRSATTIPLPTSHGSSVEFKLRAGNESIDGITYWDNSEQGEGVVVEYSLDGFNWIILQSIDTSFPRQNRWSNFSYAIPQNAVSPRTQFRWRQVKHSGAGFDSWALDDICIRANQAVTLAAPPFLMATPSSSTHVALFWFGSAGASHYIIERQQQLGTWEPIGTTGAQQTYFTDVSAMPQSTYAYRVKAATTVSQSGYSPVAFASTLSQAADWLNQNVGNTNAPLSSFAADGVPNIIRYAFNLSTDQPVHELTEESNSGTPIIWFDEETDALRAEFIQRKSSTEPGITYAFEVSVDLVNWVPVPAPVTAEGIDAIWQRVHYAAPASAAKNGPGMFGRVAIRLTP